MYMEGVLWKWTNYFSGNSCQEKIAASIVIVLFELFSHSFDVSMYLITKLNV